MRQTAKIFGDWSKGFGPIRHREDTTERIKVMMAAEHTWSGPDGYDLLSAADRLTCAAMWTVAHMTYAARVDLSGAPLPADAFKPSPEGHTGGSLNMVPAFVGYLLANALSGKTRAWIMGQGHCVAAIEAVNTLTGDVSTRQKSRYDRTEVGLSRLVSDFYSYGIDAEGRASVPLGSHAGPYTAGAVMEGGYLGFASLQYVHLPLPGETVVAFLSDGAFEEQRGSDWSPRWWRAEDSGIPVPVMILNGRRIEQRTQITQEGGTSWLVSHLQLSGFDPIIIDGRDPAAFAWAIIEAEKRLDRFISKRGRRYPAPLPYIIAETVKGFGFPGAGTNAAHNLPLSGNPHLDPVARDEFNSAAAVLFVSPDELERAVAVLSTHAGQRRPRESGHALATRYPQAPALPEPNWKDVSDPADCAMHAIDEWFVSLVDSNPGLRPRVGNPDELRSNHMGRTLARLCHRVDIPEPDLPEAIDGGVVTALNEEAVAGAALANKGGLSLIVSYEAFAVKMLGALRQEIVFARRQREIGVEPGWISVPLVVTSHTWENSKNEQSHQDPTIGEALLGELSDTARVLFPVDTNSALAAMRSVYAGRGQIACLIASKRALPHRLSPEQAIRLAEDGALHFYGAANGADVQLVAIGAYQLEECLKAAQRLEARGCHPLVTLLLEPARFRAPRDDIEAAVTVNNVVLHASLPRGLPRVIVSHTRPEPMIGLLRRIDGGPRNTTALGYISHGGTFDVGGMLFANRCTWAHIVAAAAPLIGKDHADVLTSSEIAAVELRGNPTDLWRFNAKG